MEPCFGFDERVIHDDKGVLDAAEAGCDAHVVAGARDARMARRIPRFVRPGRSTTDSANSADRSVQPGIHPAKAGQVLRIAPRAELRLPAYRRDETPATPELRRWPMDRRIGQTS